MPVSSQPPGTEPNHQLLVSSSSLRFLMHLCVPVVSSLLCLSGNDQHSINAESYAHHQASRTLCKRPTHFASSHIWHSAHVAAQTSHSLRLITSLTFAHVSAHVAAHAQNITHVFPHVAPPVTNMSSQRAALAKDLHIPFIQRQRRRGTRFSCHFQPPR